MRVENMTSSMGNKVANQFIISHWNYLNLTTIFQSYDSVIVKIVDDTSRGKPKEIYLDVNKWDYSVTTGKYRNQFLGETKAETQKKIDSGEYKLVDLNS